MISGRKVKIDEMPVAKQIIMDNIPNLFHRALDSIHGGKELSHLGVFVSKIGSHSRGVGELRQRREGSAGERRRRSNRRYIVGARSTKLTIAHRYLWKS